MYSLIFKVSYKNAKKNSNKGEEKNFAADCNYCMKTLSGNIGTNFLKHTQVNIRVS